jgi:hypothetical protein
MLRYKSPIVAYSGAVIDLQIVRADISRLSRSTTTLGEVLPIPRDFSFPANLQSMCLDNLGAARQHPHRLFTVVVTAIYDSFMYT